MFGGEDSYTIDRDLYDWLRDIWIYHGKGANRIKASKISKVRERIRLRADEYAYRRRRRWYNVLFK